jgi:type I restriction enzyme S subunit
MKDSGVEWLGEVPTHWEVKKTKNIFSMIVEPAHANNTYELLSVYTDIGVKPRKDLEAKGNKATTTDGYWKVQKKDIIVNKLLAWMGAIGVSNYEGVTSPAYDILRAKKNISSDFYHLLFRTKKAQTEFKKWSRGIMEMRLRLYFSEFGQIKMPVPPINEQLDIIHNIEVKTSKIDNLINNATKGIELLKERRTSLISAVVTGKIDVREES